MNDESATSVSLLPSAHAEAVMQRAAQIAAAGMPLSAGLLAAAEEAESPGLARALRRLSAEIDRGRSLDDVLTASRLPPNLAGLIRAAQRTGKLGAVMAEWIETRRATAQHWRAIRAALVYPVITLALTAGVFMLFAVYVIRPFEQIVAEFELRLPFNASALFYLSRIGPELLGIVLGLSLVVLLMLRLIAGRAGWSWLMTGVPLLGPAWHWTGVAEMLRSLSLLVDHHVPLPEALELTAGGITDPYVGGVCLELAKRTQQGVPLWASIVELRSLPLSIVPLIHWGEQHESLAEALRTAAEMLEGRLRVRSDLLIQVLPPFVFVLVGVLIGSLTAMLMTTMLALVQGLM
jgi:type II secretory pathway component PulF